MNSASINRCIQSLPEKSHIKRCNRKKALKPAEKRELVQYVQSEHDVSERFSSRLVGISRRVNNYVSVKNDDEIILSLRVLVYIVNQTGLLSNISSQVSQHKMPISNVLIKLLGKMFQMRTYLNQLNRSIMKHINGNQIITKIIHINHLME